MSKHGQLNDSNNHLIYGSMPIQKDSSRAASLKVFQNELSNQDSCLAAFTSPQRNMNESQQKIYANVMPKSSLDQLQRVSKKIPVC